MIAELLSENGFVWTCLWQSTVCVAAGLIGSFILRHRPARAHQVLLLALIAAVAVPAMSVMVKHLDLGLFSPEPAAVRSAKEITLPETTYAAVEIIAGDTIEYETPAVVAAEGGPAATVAAEKAAFPWRRMLSWVWIAASLTLAARLGVTFVRGVRLLRRATPLSCEEIQAAARVAKSKLAITEEVSVLASRNIHSPVIWCWTNNPVLLVPSNETQAGNEIDWVSVLCHELAHYKRHDHISGLLGEIVLCALPWNLLLWWAKSRLVKLSEQACDDWVLASGQSSADYARSLLDLVPQGQLALLPTVVASKKELQTRVRRIVQNRCSDPRAGGRWAVLVTIVAACLALGTALAQEGRTDKETPRREAAAPEPRQEGEGPRERAREPGEAERAELIQLRQTLLGKISGIERELKQLPHDRDVEARELQTRLSAIRDQVRDIDRKLAGRERGDAPVREQGEREMRTRELTERRRALQQQAQQIERRLAERPDSADAPQLRTELREIREQTQRIENELRDAEQYQRQRREPQRPEADARVRELMEQREQLGKKARDIERRLAERPDSPEAEELQAELRAIRERSRQAEIELREIERRQRERPEPQRPEQARAAEEYRRAIARALEQGRREDADRLERELRQIAERPATRPEPRPETPGLEQQVRELRNEVQGLRQEMAELRELLKQLLQRQRPEGGQRPERERSPEAQRLEPGPRPEQRQPGAETPRF